MKNNSNKKIYITLGIFTAILLLLVGAYVFNSLKKKNEVKAFDVSEVRYKDPLILKGIARPTFIEEYKYDPSKGKVSEIHVKDGQTVKKDDKLFTYELMNETKTIKAQNDGYIKLNEDNKENPQDVFIAVKTDNTFIKGSVTEYDYAKLKKDQAAELYVLASKETVKGKITSVSKDPNGSGPSSAADMMGQAPTSSGTSYEFKVQPEKFIMNGYSVNVKIPYSDIIIPGSAVVNESDKTFVYVHKDGKAIKKEIKIEKDKDATKVTSGLELGESVITNPSSALKDGMQIKVK